MKLKPEDGYWTLAKSTAGDYIRGSSFLKKYGKGILVVVIVILFFGSPIYYTLATGDCNPSLITCFFLLIFIPFILPAAVLAVAGRILYGCFRNREKKDVDLPNAEFHGIGYCQNLGKRILNMIKEINVADHYIFLLNFHNLFYHEEHKLENPDQGMLDGIGKAVRVLPEEQTGTVWTRNPFQALASGSAAGKKAAGEQIVKGIAEKLGGLPEPNEAVAIITKEYLPELTGEFPRDVAMYIAVAVCSAHNYTAVFPYDGRVVSEEEAVAVATNPTRENIVDYCSKFAGLEAEEPIPRRKGLMED